jgi:hypothetical protein
MRRPLLVLLLLAVVSGALVWAALRQDSGQADQPLIVKVQDALDEDAAKGLVEGRLGDFLVIAQTGAGELPEEASVAICHASTPVPDRAVLKAHELWSDALGPTASAGHATVVRSL